MRGAEWGWVFLGIVLSSCGTETVTTLSPPISSTAYLSQSDYTQLTATFPTSVPTGYLGWEVYYRIYPLSSTTVSSNLASDVSSLSASPTRDYLVSLGYQRMNGSYSSSSILPLLSYSAGSAVTLSFGNFFDTYNVSPIPTSIIGNVIGSISPTIQGGGSTVSLYRTVTTSGTTTYPYFNQLYSNTFTQTSDMASTVSSSSVTPLEIDVFLIAYDFTLENGTQYSTPEPWGVLKSLAVP